MVYMIEETEEFSHRRLGPEVGRSQGVEVTTQGAEPRSITRSRISFKDERNSEIDEEHRRCQRFKSSIIKVTRRRSSAYPLYQG